MSQEKDSRQYIKIRGANEHNLKNIDVDIPRNKLVVLTGLSGSGKSSLAFDTIYAEGQRRYMESLSSYARQFLGQMGKPLDAFYVRLFHLSQELSCIRGQGFHVSSLPFRIDCIKCQR